MGGEYTYRLVSFLGKPRNSYKPTVYVMDHGNGQRKESRKTRFLTDALNQLLRPQEVVILATDEAWKEQGAKLKKQIGDVELKHVQFPAGGTEQELWNQFDVLKEQLRLPDGISPRTIALDITHGFRSQPFFAAGAVTFIQLVDENPPDVSIYYGAWEERGEDNRTPVWDLTPFADLISWSSHIMLFLKTGCGEGLAAATEAIGSALRKEWALAGRKGNQPSLGRLGKALARFAEDLEMVRTGSLMLDGSGTSSTRALSEAIKDVGDADGAKDTAGGVLRPLLDVLDKIKSLVEPLITDSRLSDREGLRALGHLARVYYDMGRYAEAASTIREAYINQHACDKSDCPGDPSFAPDNRKAAEKRWREANEDLAREIADVRNDIGHAGYKSQPMPPKTIRKKIDGFIKGLTHEEAG